MTPKPDAAADGQTTAPKKEAAAPKAAPLSLHCKVLVNGMLYADAHHAKGKLMSIPEDKANYLAQMTPPQVEIIGVQ